MVFVERRDNFDKYIMCPIFIFKNDYNIDKGRKSN